MVLCLCLLSAILLGILYLFFGAFPLIFENNHNFTLPQVGMSFIGLLVGMLLGMFNLTVIVYDRLYGPGIISDPIWRYNYRRLIRNREAATGEEGVAEPEYRLPPVIFGTQLCWIGLIGFAFTTYSFVSIEVSTSEWLI